MLAKSLALSNRLKLIKLYYKCRLPLVLAANLMLVFGSYFIALALRFDFIWTEIFAPNRLLFPFFLLALSRHACYMRWNLNQCYWRYVSTPDLLRLFKAHLLSTIIFSSLVLLFRVDSFPRSVIFVEFVLSIMIQGGARVATRLIRETLITKVAKDYDRSHLGRHVLVLGAGDSGHLVVKNLLSFGKLGYVPAAVLDDNERYIGSKVHGVPIIGKLAELEPALEQYPRVTAVIVAIPSLGERKYAWIKEVCDRGNVVVKRVQSFEDIACQDVATRTNRISIESVLDKAENVTRDQAVFSVLRGRRVLITGAGGSIGSEIVRQVMNFEIDLLVLFDCCEYNLFKILNEIQDLKFQGKIVPIIGSIVDQTRLIEVFNKYSPEFVFHTAAYKHVPLMEQNVREAFVNNVVGTRNILEVASQNHVERFIFISSDKAVAPKSVMGCTKRIGELLAKFYCKLHQNPLEVVTVRFGNVINSSGSVIPLWKKQISKGGPLTLTHPDMERYFMSIREAVRLVLISGVLGDAGEIYVLDMGNPIRIEEVAKKMLALYGRRDIKIVYTGIRPGEKLKEELSYSQDRIENTCFTGVGRLVEGANVNAVTEWLANRENNFASFSEDELKQDLFKIVSVANLGVDIIDPQKKVVGIL